MSRKLVTLRTIDQIKPIEGADKIELAIVDGWQAVVKKGDFSVGEVVLYFEIDSFVPHDIAPFLTKNNKPRVYKGVKGNRIKTVKLRGQISQGLVMKNNLPYGYEVYNNYDLSSYFGVIKWELEDKLMKNPQAAGSFPSFIRKTDQERVQNIANKLSDYKDELVEVTMKLDGSSMTIFSDKGNSDNSGICSRNVLLKMDEEFSNTHFHKVNKNEQLLGKLKDYCSSNNSMLALQGEIMGPGIQGNREGFDNYRFFLFDIFDFDKQEYLSHEERMIICTDLGLKHAPIMDTGLLGELGLDSAEACLEYASGPSINNKVREGIVVKSLDGRNSFKAISNEFLLGGGN